MESVGASAFTSESVWSRRTFTRTTEPWNAAVTTVPANPVLLLSSGPTNRLSGRTNAFTRLPATSRSAAAVAMVLPPTCTERPSLPTTPGISLTVPTKRATNDDVGSWYTVVGDPICSSRPFDITPTRSDTASASSWSWVTNKVVGPVES